MKITLQYADGKELSQTIDGELTDVTAYNLLLTCVMAGELTLALEQTEDDLFNRNLELVRLNNEIAKAE